MSPPTGASLYDLIIMYRDNQYMPRKFSGLRDLEDGARQQGFEELSDYVKSWRKYIEYQIKAEWNVYQS